MRIGGIFNACTWASYAIAAVQPQRNTQETTIGVRSSASTGASDCSTTNLSLASFNLPGSNINSITATTNTNVSGLVSQTGVSIPPVSICNITIVYGHKGWNDTITVTVWLPIQGWTSRLVGAGGGGLAVRSGDDSLAVEVAAGRAAFATDGGHDWTIQAADGWALNATGRVNYFLLQDYGSVALNDAAILSKQAIKAYYGSSSKFYTYWNGCSAGGRQGYMLAQRYPTAIDGIVAGAPAINWVQLAPSFSWPAFVMTQVVKTVPPPCVLNFITNATITACDSLDGVTDGIVSAWEQCHFDPSTLVNQSIDCGEFGRTVITQAQTDVAKLIWQGPRARDSSFLWYGLTPGTPLQMGFKLSGIGLDDATISCVNSISNCSIEMFGPAGDWIRLFIFENPKFDPLNTTYEQWEYVMNQTASKYRDILATDNPDLSGLKSAGGKLLSWHGTADQLIPHQGTHNYFNRVQALDPDVREYYRHFDAPGLNHCLIGKSGGFAPTDLMDKIIAWVENGTAPATLQSRTEDGKKTRPLCQYPLVAAYSGGNASISSSFQCSGNFSTVT